MPAGESCSSAATHHVHCVGFPAPMIICQTTFRFEEWSGVTALLSVNHREHSGTYLLSFQRSVVNSLCNEKLF